MWMYSDVFQKVSGHGSRILISITILLAGMLVALSGGYAQGSTSQLTDYEIILRNIPILERMTAGKDGAGMVAIDDMLMTVDQAWSMFCLGARTKDEIPEAIAAAQANQKAGIRSTTTPWTGAVVQYAFGSGFDGAGNAARRTTFVQATQMWAASGVTFVDITSAPSGNYMNVVAVSPPNPSSSTVGMGGGGAQTYNISTDQMTIDTMAHELGHGLGLSHPHQRWDRDTYVTFSAPPNPNDVTSLALVTPESAWNACSGEYNVCDIMHYSCCAMAWDDDAPPPPGSSTPGDWVAYTMSANDGTPSNLIGMGDLIGSADAARGRPTPEEINAVRCFYALSAAPTITVDSPTDFVVCSAITDVELEGFAGTTGEGGIASVQFTNDGLNWFTVGVTLATPNLSLTHYVINLGPPGNTALPNTNGPNIIGVRAVSSSGSVSSPVFVTINVSLEAPSVTIEEEDPITLYDDDAMIAKEIHGNAGSCMEDPITLIEYQINAFGFTSANVEAAPLPSEDVTYVVKIPERIWSPGDVITVRATTRDGVTAEQMRTIVIIDIDPTVTIEAPEPIELCDQDSPIAVEIHGNAGSSPTDPISTVSYRINAFGFSATNVETAPLPAQDVNYVVRIPARLWTSGDVITVQAVTLQGQTVTQSRTILVTDIDPAVTIESPSPLDVAATEADVELQGFASNCVSDPIAVVEWQVAGAATWNNATMLASSNDDFVSWVVRLGAPTLTGGTVNANLPGNPTTINLRAFTDYGLYSEVVSTTIRWPEIAITDPNMTLSGPVGSGLGVVKEIEGYFTVENIGTVPTGQINTNLIADLLASYVSGGGVTTIYFDNENVVITPEEFHLDPAQTQSVSIEMVVPVNTSIGPDGVVFNVAPGNGLDYSGVVRVQGDSVNTLNQDLVVRVEPYRDKDLFRRGFTGFCEDCADAWQIFSFPLVGVDNPISPTLLGSTLRNQLEDDFGLVNEGPAPFQAIRWDPARRDNLSFYRYNPPRELLEPNPQSHGFAPNILPGEGFSLVRRTRGDITLDGYFVDHAPGLPQDGYPLVRFPNWDRVDDYRGSWDPTFPPPVTPIPAAPAPFTTATHLMVGNPFAFPIDIYKQGVYDGSTVVAQMNVLGYGDLVRDVRHYNRWVGQLFLEIQNALSIPESFSPWNGTLQPTQGCWVTFGTEATLAYGIRFNDPPIVSDDTAWPQMIDFTSSKKKSKSGVELPADFRDLNEKAVVLGWGYRLTAINTEGLYRTVIVGAFPGAQAGYDIADVESTFSDETRPDDMDFDFVISHPDWGNNGLFLRDLTNPDSIFAGVSIPIQLLSTVKDDITLVSETIGTPPARLVATLTGADGDTSVDLTSSAGSLSVSSGTTGFTITLKAWETADINQDDSIDSLDLFGFSREYEKLEKSNPADLNNNNKVEAKDLIELLNGMK